MCGRSSLTRTEKELEKRFEAEFYSEDLERYNPLPNFNVAPTQMHPVITNQDQNHLQFFKWGLVPFWAKDMKIGSRMINARIETIMEKPAYKGAVQKRRCIVPYDGFYEWKRKGSVKIPYRITLLDHAIFCIAGIWEQWKSPTGDKMHTFSLLTGPPNEKMAEVHNRMPVILTPEEEKLWLDDSISAASLVESLKPLPEDMLHIYPVSTRVNNVRNNDAQLIEKIEETKDSLF